MASLKSSFSSLAIFFIGISIIVIFFAFDIWKQNRITIDVPSYYTYLPSTFIYHDLKLNYSDQNPEFFKDKIWFYKIPNGNRLIKHPMGLSVALLPFFFIGHFAAHICNSPRDGYSLPYQNALSIGVIIYFLTGLFFLRKVLLIFFDDRVIAITFLSIVLGTNLLWYLTFEGLMTHGIGFSLLCICIFTFFNWLENGNRKYLIAFSIAFGIILLIRPLAITLLIYFLIYGIISKRGVKNFFSFLKHHFRIILFGVIIIFSFFSLQLFYWKYITGHWYFDAYIDEHFIFNRLQVIPFLFSFNKGLFVYTPLMILVALGFIFLFRTNRAIFFATLCSVVLTIYVFSSWWAWNYGISWGMRPMIDSYSLLCFPLAAFFTFVFNQKKFFIWLTCTIILLLVLLNLFQTWQYKNSLIHFDSMTRKAYFKGFFQIKPSLEWYDLLRPIDWERHKKGLPQIEYSKKYFDAIDKNDWVYFRGFNLYYLTENKKRENIITCSETEVRNNELFHLIRVNGDTVGIQSSNGKFLSVKNKFNGALIADEDHAGFNEKFIFKVIDDDDNRINLQTLDGKNVFVNPQKPFVLFASPDPRTEPFKIFRLFVLKND